MRAAAVALLLVFVTCVLHTVVGSTTSCNQTCPAPVLSSVTLMNGAWSENPPNKSWDITWSTQYDSDTEAVDKCYGNDTNPNNYFNRTCSWTLECNQPNMTNSSVVFYNLSVDLSPSRSYTNVFFNLEFFKEDNVTNLKTLMFSMYNQNITGALQSGTAHNLAFPNSAASFPGVPQGQGYVLASSGQKAHIVSTFFTNADNGQTQNQTQLDMNLAMHFECDQFSRCRTEVPIRNLTCPAPVLSNITQPPFVNGSWSIHPYNKSWDIAWYAEYNKSIDVLDRCYENDTNPYNFFNRTCAWTLECNKPNVTNGSVVFFNLSVDLFTPERRLDTNVFLNLEFFNEDNITNLTTFMFGMYNRTITGFQQSGTTHNFAFPNRATGIPDVPLGQGFILTSNWRQKAHIVATFFTNNDSGRDALVYQTDIGMNLSMHFECDQFFINVTVYEDDDILGVALGIPLGLIALLVLLAILKWKYPNMCNCCDKNRDGSDNFDDDEKILAAARARREGRDLAQPMMELQDKAGMQTWLDQAEDVVEDLNKNCLYLEEAKADSQMNKGFDALEAGVNPTMASHKDGFIGGRQLYAVGGASGGVKVIDHRPTMQTKGGGADEDPVL